MPNSPPFSIRRLSAADAEAFRAVRLEGLERHPSAFGASLKEESARPLSFFAERLDANHVLGAENEGRLSGVAGFRLHDSEKTRHRGTLWGMYVRQEARGTGVARRLVDGILDHARGRVEQVALSVWAENPAAIALYKSAGFVVFARDERSLKIDGVYYDELLMQISFTHR
jgi:ribosomal protein S18 acetylase RimI-like enzyme